MEITSHKRQIAAAIMAASVTCGVEAQLAQNLTIHPKALALGNAVTADPPGIMAIHYNPAGLTKLDGRQLEVNLMSVYLDIDADFHAPDGYEIFGIDGLETDPLANSGTRSQTNTAIPTMLPCISRDLAYCGRRLAPPSPRLPVSASTRPGRN
jgi:long-subunit fatty acid transport protein